MRHIDAIDKGAFGPVRYTVMVCAAWPAHVGNSYTASPKWFAGKAVSTAEPTPTL